MKSIKFPLMLLAIIIAAAGVFAFTIPAKHAKKFTTYHYTGGSDFDDMKNPDLWDNASPEVGCGETGDIPCTISTDENLVVYLNSFGTAAALVEDAVSRRE